MHLKWSVIPPFTYSDSFGITTLLLASWDRGFRPEPTFILNATGTGTARDADQRLGDRFIRFKVCSPHIRDRHLWKRLKLKTETENACFFWFIPSSPCISLSLRRSGGQEYFQLLGPKLPDYLAQFGSLLRGARTCMDMPSVGCLVACCWLFAFFLWFVCRCDSSLFNWCDSRSLGFLGVWNVEFWKGNSFGEQYVNAPLRFQEALDIVFENLPEADLQYLAGVLARIMWQAASQS